MFLLAVWLLRVLTAVAPPDYPNMANNNVVTMSGSGPSSNLGKGSVVIALTRVLSLAVPRGKVEVI